MTCISGVIQDGLGQLVMSAWTCQAVSTGVAGCKMDQTFPTGVFVRRVGRVPCATAQFARQVTGICIWHAFVFSYNFRMM